MSVVVAQSRYREVAATVHLDRVTFAHQYVSGTVHIPRGFNMASPWIEKFEMDCYNGCATEFQDDCLNARLLPFLTQHDVLLLYLALDGLPHRAYTSFRGHIVHDCPGELLARSAAHACLCRVPAVSAGPMAQIDFKEGSLRLDSDAEPTFWLRMRLPARKRTREERREAIGRVIAKWQK